VNVQRVSQQRNTQAPPSLQRLEASRPPRPPVLEFHNEIVDPAIELMEKEALVAASECVAPTAHFPIQQHESLREPTLGASGFAQVRVDVGLRFADRQLQR